MATNSRPPKTNLYAAATAAGGAAVYRQTPSPTGSTTTLPTAGQVPAVDCWMEVYEHGAQTPTHILIAKAGVPAFPTTGQTSPVVAGVPASVDVS